jgi:hypothetical protein
MVAILSNISYHHLDVKRTQPLARSWVFGIIGQWRVGEEVTRESAKLLCAGPIPARASGKFLWQQILKQRMVELIRSPEDSVMHGDYLFNRHSPGEEHMLKSRWLMWKN